MHVQETLKDEEVIRKIIAGEKAFFEILIRRYNPVLYRTGRACRYGHEDTQDLMQDAFISAFLALPDFEHRASFKTWLVKIMLHQCYRKRQKFSFSRELHQELPEKSTPMFSDPQQHDTGKRVLDRELGIIIEEALQQLPEEHRLVFALREINGFSVRETAEALEISEANVKTRTSRAKALLRLEVEKSYNKTELFEFNKVYCDGMVERVMREIGEFKI